jgi:hypothetical protein
LAPPFIVYVTTAFAVPINEIEEGVPEQMVVAPEIVAVGEGATVTGIVVVGEMQEPPGLLTFNLMLKGPPLVFQLTI